MKTLIFLFDCNCHLTMSFSNYNHLRKLHTAIIHKFQWFLSYINSPSFLFHSYPLTLQLLLIPNLDSFQLFHEFDKKSLSTSLQKFKLLIGLVNLSFESFVPCSWILSYRHKIRRCILFSFFQLLS